MSKLKDKLSANMRTVKASQQSPATEDAVHKRSEKPAATRPKQTSAPPSSASVAGDVPPSGTALFPSRVWPD